MLIKSKRWWGLNDQECVNRNQWKWIFMSHLLGRERGLGHLWWLLGHEYFPSLTFIAYSRDGCWLWWSMPGQRVMQAIEPHQYLEVECVYTLCLSGYSIDLYMLCVWLVRYWTVGYALQIFIIHVWLLQNIVLIIHHYMHPRIIWKDNLILFLLANNLFQLSHSTLVLWWINKHEYSEHLIWSPRKTSKLFWFMRVRLKWQRAYCTSVYGRNPTLSITGCHIFWL